MSSDEKTIRAVYACAVTGTDERAFEPVKLIHVCDKNMVYKQLTRTRNKMEELRQQQYGTDVVLRCMDGVIHVHKVVLIYFEAMLTADMFEKNSGEINFQIFDKKVIEIIVEYLYTAQLPILNKDDDLLPELISTCRLIRIHDLLDHCLDRLVDDVSVETFLKVWSLATKFDLCRRDYKLLRLIGILIEALAENEIIQLLNETEMSYLIECGNDVACSNAIARCIFKWKCNGDRNRERAAVRLLQKIKLQCLDDETVYDLLELNRSTECNTFQHVLISEAVARSPARLYAFMSFAPWDAERNGQ